MNFFPDGALVSLSAAVYVGIAVLIGAPQVARRWASGRVGLHAVCEVLFFRCAYSIY